MIGNKRSRWLLALAIIGVVLVASIVLILTNRAPSERIVLKAVSDGSGGTFVAWYQNQEIHVQRTDSDGNLLWLKEVVLENTKLKQPDHFTMVEDGQDGVIISWGDMSTFGDDSDDPSYFSPVPIYSQRLNANGEPLWGKGVPTGTGEHHGLALTIPQVMPDGTGGAYIFWNDFKPAFKALHDDYFRLQRLDPEGKPVWEQPGKLLFASPPFHTTTAEEKAQGEKGAVTRARQLWTGINIVSDGQGGAIMVWKEEMQPRYADIRAQCYDANGKPVWQEGGVLIYSALDASIQVTVDGNGGAILIIGAGSQESSGSATYSVQRVTSEGKLLWPDAGVVIKEGLRPWGSIEVMTQGMDTLVLWQETVGRPEIIDGRPIQQIALNAKRISAEGNIAWQRTPVFTSKAGESFGDLVMDNDEDGVPLAWRAGGREQWGGKVFAQKVNTTDGNILWDGNNVTVFGSELQYQGTPVMVNDGSGGAIILAVVGKNPIGGDMVYAQRLDTSGNTMWGEGIKVSR